MFKSCKKFSGDDKILNSLVIKNTKITNLHSFEVKIVMGIFLLFQTIIDIFSMTAQEVLSKKISVLIHITLKEGYRTFRNH